MTDLERAREWLTMSVEWIAVTEEEPSLTKLLDEEKKPAPRDPFNLDDPKTCPHAWERHMWSKDELYCPLCGSSEERP